MLCLSVVRCACACATLSAVEKRFEVLLSLVKNGVRI